MGYPLTFPHQVLTDLCGHTYGQYTPTLLGQGEAQQDWESAEWAWTGYTTQEPAAGQCSSGLLAMIFAPCFYKHSTNRDPSPLGPER